MEELGRQMRVAHAVVKAARKKKALAFRRLEIAEKNVSKVCREDTQANIALSNIFIKISDRLAEEASRAKKKATKKV